MRNCFIKEVLLQSHLMGCNRMDPELKNQEAHLPVFQWLDARIIHLKSPKVVELRRTQYDLLQELGANLTCICSY
jgi:hypothetical protein